MNPSFYIPKKHHTAQKMISIKDLSRKCDQFRNFLQIWSHWLRESLMENSIICAVSVNFSFLDIFRKYKKRTSLHL